MIEGAETIEHNKLRIGCFNAQSICNKVCGTLEMLNDKSVDICCISETWLKSKDKSIFSEIHDFGFDILSSPRKGKGGGVAFVFNPDRVKVDANYVKGFKSFEVFECIIKAADKVVRLCTVYRTTKTKDKINYDLTKVSVFMDEFDKYLDTLVEKCGSPIICGDFNFHIEDPKDLNAQKFVTLCESKGFTQHVTGPTHVSGGTLDLIFTITSCSDNLSVKNLIVDPDTGTTSDHYLAYFDLPLQLNSLQKCHSETKDVREFKKMNLADFREDLFCSPLNLIEFKSVEEAVDVYQNVVQSILDKHAPLTSKTFKVDQSPWWDSSCQQAKRDMKKAQRKFYKNKDDEEAREVFNEKCIDKAIVINKARHLYYSQKLSSSVGNAKATQKVVSHLLDKEFGSNKLPHRENDSTLAEDFKSFFDGKVKNIYSSILEETNKSCNSPVQDVPQQSPYCSPKSFITFRPVTVDELLDIAKDLSNKSCDLDVIPMWLFKECLPELINSIHYIVNESLLTGVFPTQLKTAVIRPSLKKSTLDPDVLGNYRPISNLQYISKLIEKVVHIQLIEFLDDEGLLSKFQSAYRKCHSCETAVTRIYNDLLIMMDKRNNVVLLLLDLSAAFDTINHGRLLKKLENMYGINGTVLKWLKSYLSCRKFKVSINGTESTECLLDIGVPQGSILGPLLFILYTKELEQIVTKYGLSIHLYADDTQIYFSFDVNNKNLDLTPIKLCLSEVKLWMSDNFLKLNDEKTEFLDIGYYVSPLSSLDLGESYGELSIAPVLMAKNLGFYFDDQLNMNKQISFVSQICYLNLRDLKRIGSKLTRELKVQLVHSNIMSYIDYCNASYAGLTKQNIHRLQKLQNNAVRFVFQLTGKKKWEHIKPFLKKLHFLPVEYRIKFKLSLLVFKCLNNLAPDYLKNLITLRESKRVSMRLDDDFYVLKVPKTPNFSRTEASFTYAGPRTWNELPYRIRSLTDLELFKKQLKTHYFELAFTGID